MEKNNNIGTVVVTALITAILLIAGFFGYHKYVKEPMTETVTTEVTVTPEKMLQTFQNEKIERATDSIYYSLPDYVYLDIMHRIGVTATKNRVVEVYQADIAKYQQMSLGIKLQKEIEQKYQMLSDSVPK